MPNLKIYRSLHAMATESEMGPGVGVTSSNLAVTQFVGDNMGAIPFILWV